MPQELLTFLKRTLLEPQSEPVPQTDLPLATAVLLIRAAVVDGSLEKVEMDKLHELLKRRFDLDEEEVQDLIERGREKERESVDLYHFTKVITDKLDMDGRLQLIEYLWETAYADGVLDEYESNLIWRVAELIGVETRDRVRLRQRVQAKLGIDNDT